MSDTPVVKVPRGFAAMTPEARRAAQQKSAATRLANRQAAAVEPKAPRGEAPPDPPPNYGRLPEAGSGGAIDPARHSIGGLGENDPAVQGRPLAPDVVGLEPAPTQAPRRVVRKESELPFHARGVAPAEVVIEDSPDVKSWPAGSTMVVLPNWDTCDLREGQDTLDAAHALLEEGARKLQSRVSAAEEGNYTCVQCGRPIPDLRQAKMIQARRDPVTQIITNDVWCSARCYTAGISAGQFAPAAAKG
jgi:hypothetical protein